MKTLMLTIDESIADSGLENTLLAIRGVKSVKYTHEAVISADWKSRLHLPGIPLNDTQMEELAIDMENETEFVSLEEAYANGLQRISEWQSKIG